MSKYRYGPYLVAQLLLKKRKEKQVINVYSYKRISCNILLDMIVVLYVGCIKEAHAVWECT